MSAEALAEGVFLMLTDLDYEHLVVPFYLKVLHGNYAAGYQGELSTEQAIFAVEARTVLDEITPAIARELIVSHWRPALCGSWFAGLAQLTECREDIGRRLLASETCFAGQGHTFALACFGDDQSADLLVRYLDAYLPRLDCAYDQHWAIAALMWIDEKRDWTLSQRFLVPGGLWDMFSHARGSAAWNLESGMQRFRCCMAFCRDHITRSR